MRALTGALRSAGAAAAWLAIVACTSEGARPPELGDCVAGDAGCSVATPGAGGGGNGSEAGTSGTCPTNANDSLCAQCASSDCCGPLEACLGNTDCQNLMSCTDNCGGSSNCVNDCESQYITSVNALVTFDECLEQKCVICAESGVGDPCYPQESTCISGLTCAGSWCTKACTRGSDCTGIGPLGGNSLGPENACIHSESLGNVCFPGCLTDSDCDSFPGSYCFATTSLDDLAVSVCVGALDAGHD